MTDEYYEQDNQQEYDLNLVSLESDAGLPSTGKNLVVVAKIGNFYHVRIFDRTGHRILDKGNEEFSPDEMLVREMDAAFSNQLIDDQTKKELIKRLVLSVGHNYQQGEDQQVVDAIEMQEQKQIEKSRLIQLITSYRSFYRRIKPIIVLLWIFIILVVFIPLIGRLALSHAASKKMPLSMYQSSSIVFVSQSQVDSSLQKAIFRARIKAKEYASQKLDVWINNLLKPKVDPGFLNWYFNYFNRKGMEISAAYRWVSGQDAAAAAAEDFQKEFSSRVLSQGAAQRKIDRITRETVDVFIKELYLLTPEIVEKYDIPEGEWDMYLNDIASSVPRPNENKTFGEAAAVGTYASVKLAATLAVGATEKIATSFGLKLGVKVGAAGTAAVIGEVLDPLVTVGLVLWDTWDYHKTVDNERPILKASIFDYFEDMKSTLINDADSGIMSVVDAKEQSIRRYLLHSAINTPRYNSTNFTTL